MYLNCNNNDKEKAKNKQIDLTKIYGNEYKIPDGLTAEDVARIIKQILREQKQ